MPTIIKKCGFETTDGKFFEDEDEALLHQRKLDHEKLVQERRIEAIRLIANSKLAKLKRRTNWIGLQALPPEVTTKDVQEELEVNGGYIGLRPEYEYHHEKDPSWRSQVQRARSIVDLFFRFEKELDLIKHLL